MSDDDSLVKDKTRLARYIFCAFVADAREIPLKEAERRMKKTASKEPPSWCFRHVAEYLSRLAEGYLPLDLDEMVKPPDAEPLPIQ